MHASNGTDGQSELRRVKVVGLSLMEERRLRERLRRQSPSEPWVDVQIVEKPDVSHRGALVVRRHHDPSAFPPGGARTGMLRCSICGILTPPHAMEGGACLDHREDGGWGPSPSALAIGAARYYHVSLKQMDLASESDEVLQRKIRKYQRKHGLPQV